MAQLNEKLKYGSPSDSLERAPQNYSVLTYSVSTKTYLEQPRPPADHEGINLLPREDERACTSGRHRPGQELHPIQCPNGIV